MPRLPGEFAVHGLMPFLLCTQGEHFCSSEFMRLKRRTFMWKRRPLATCATHPSYWLVQHPSESSAPAPQHWLRGSATSKALPINIGEAEWFFSSAI